MAGNEFFLEGRLIKKYDTQQVTASFSKREFVVEVPGTYVQYAKFELKQAKCGELDGYNEGDQIKVHFNIEGRQWQDKYFTNLSAWRLERAGGQNNAPSNNSYSTPNSNNSWPTADDAPKTSNSFANNSSNDSDDLPF